MERRKFIKQSCIACMTGLSAVTILESCGGTKYLAAAIRGTDMILPIDSFLISDNKPGEYRKYVIAEHKELSYPVAIFRRSETNYDAIYLRCTHQRAELRVLGDRLECPSHGSKFDSHGQVLSGPADTPLRKFLVEIQNQELKISLK